MSGRAKGNAAFQAARRAPEAGFFRWILTFRDSELIIILAFLQTTISLSSAMTNTIASDRVEVVPVWAAQRLRDGAWLDAGMTERP